MDNNMVNKIWVGMSTTNIHFRGVVLSTKNPTGCTANMGSKISLLVYEWPLKKCEIWYMNGSIFQNFLRWFCSKLGRLVHKWVTFSWKIGICMGLISNSSTARPYQNQTWVQPGFLYSNSKFKVTYKNADFECRYIIPKKTCLKFLTLHSPFCFFLNYHPVYFGVHFSWSW